MDRHVVCRIGKEDTFAPLVREEERVLPFHIDTPDVAGSVGRYVLSKLRENALQPTQAAVDLYRVATTAFVSDLRIPRGSSYDGWARAIGVYVPVSDTARWRDAQGCFQELLKFLTGDVWGIHLRESKGSRIKRTAEVSRGEDVPGDKTASGYKLDGVCLLSGGLDSFIGAADALAAGNNIALVSHYARGSSQHQSPAQDRTYEALKNQYNSRFTRHLKFHVSPPTLSKDSKAEGSQRSRSIIYLALATLVASALETKSRETPVPILIPENGFISLNVPLTYGRLGSHSTRTTHPYTIHLFQQLLDNLGVNAQVSNSCYFKTKGEMLLRGADPDFLKAYAKDTVSCSTMGYRQFRRGKQCGFCMPCVVRRAAMAKAGIDSPKHYFKDVVSGTFNVGSVADNNLKAIGLAMRRAQDNFLAAEVLKAGPLSVPDQQVEAFIDIYRRGLEEIEHLLPKLKQGGPSS